MPATHTAALRAGQRSIWSADLGSFLQPDQYAYLSRGGTLWSWPGQNPFRWRDPSGRLAEGILGPNVLFSGLGAYLIGYGFIGPWVFNQQDASLNFMARAAARERENQGRPNAGESCKTEAGGGAGRGRVPPPTATDAADDDPLPRFNGSKPKYMINDAHVPGRGLRPGKTPLPTDAEEVFSRAVPNDPENPTAWFGRRDSGQVYRFSMNNEGTMAHFSGIRGVGSGTRNITPYALRRLGLE